MLTRLRVLGVLFGFLSVPSCAGDDGNGSSTGGSDSATTGVGIDCVPGAELPCTCAGGMSGTQLCLASGKEKGPCSCDAGTATGSSGTSSGSSSSSGSSDTGTSTGTT